EDENGKRDLDRGPSPMIFLIDRIDEQRPAVLQVGDHHHADDAENQLSPARRLGGGRSCGHYTRRRRHVLFPPSALSKPSGFYWSLPLGGPSRVRNWLCAMVAAIGSKSSPGARYKCA